MLCALTVRKVKPGKAEEFIKNFRPPDDEVPGGWKRFYAIRNLADPDEVITFGIFDGDLDQLNASQAADDRYEERIKEVESLIESTGTSGVFEVLVDKAID
ncbi:MAG: hypothetical protein KDB57_12010 [Solirubrobacterales bacterium]|jgi:heme-degrading monooxygenase HmoA|nr:hypothetical protein [Solirubrobacterales bacterium]